MIVNGIRQEQELRLNVAMQTESLLAQCEVGKCGWRTEYFNFISSDLPLLLQMAEAAEACGSESKSELSKILNLIQSRIEDWGMSTMDSAKCTAESFARWKRGKKQPSA